VGLQIGLCHEELPADAVRLMSSSGDLYALRYDMRTPFVEWMVAEIEKKESISGGLGATYDSPFNIDNLRRYLAISIE